LIGWTQEAYICNPSYSGGRDQEDHGLRPAQIKSKTLSQKYPMQKRAGRVAQVVECLLVSMRPWVQAPVLH
jgi:hypothetical protein